MFIYFRQHVKAVKNPYYPQQATPYNTPQHPCLSITSLKCHSLHPLISLVQECHLSQHPLISLVQECHLSQHPLISLAQECHLSQHQFSSIAQEITPSIVPVHPCATFQHHMSIFNLDSLAFPGYII